MFTLEQGQEFMRRQYGGLTIVSQYLNDRNDAIMSILPQKDTPYRDQIFKMLWLRVRGWLLSLKKLDDPVDYQPIATAVRALLEITVDMLFLYRDKTDETGQKMHWHKESQKFKSAKSIVDYFAPDPVPARYEPQCEFYQLNETLIEGVRQRYWPNKKKPNVGTHPDRWTGRNLSDDIDDIDKTYGSFVKDELNMILREFYATEYRKLNWSIHSGVSSVADLQAPYFPANCGFSYGWCSDFAMLCTQIILTDYEFTTYLAGLKDS